MKTTKLINKAFLKTTCAAIAMASLSIISSCSDDDPKKENTPELITKATLTFTPAGGGPAVVATATDPDGEGVQDIEVDGPIDLDADQTYVLTIELINELADPSEAEYNITEEVEEEGDEHQFFFSWTNNVFSDPAGNGNIDNGTDAVNYTGAPNSTDENDRPLGLTTTWTSSVDPSAGSFRVLLKHQPDLKSDTSDSNTGDTDVDLTFTINVE